MLTSTNVSQVSETAMDGATSHNASGSNGDVDTFTKTALGANPVVIFGVQVKTAVRSTSPPRTRCRMPSSPVACSVSERRLRRIRPYNGRFFTAPASGAAWTVSGLDAAEFGYQRVT